MKPLHPENFDAENREHAQEPPRPSLHHIVRSDLKAFLDGELSSARVWFVRWHLLGCPECREEVNWLKHLGEDMRDLESATPGPHLRARILAALPETTPARTARSRPVWGGALRWAPASLAVLTMALGGGIVASRYHAAGRNVSGPNSNLVATNIVRSPGSPHESSQGKTSKPNTFESREIPLPHGEDPYSHEADEIVRQWDKERTRHVSEKLRQNRSNWDQMLADLHTFDLKKMNGAEQVRMALSVVDVSAAEKQLTAWAEAAGGTAALPPDQKPPVHGVAPAALSTQPGGGSAPAGGPESIRGVVMRVPLARAVKLESVLVRIGALPASAAGDRSQPGSALAPSQATHPATAVKSADGPAASGNFRDTPDQSAGRDGGERLVTLVIEMDALTNNLP